MIFLGGAQDPIFLFFHNFFLLSSHFFPLDTLLKFFLIILYSIAHILLIDDEHFHTFFGIEQCNNSMCLTKHNSINLQYFMQLTKEVLKLWSFCCKMVQTQMLIQLKMR